MAIKAFELYGEIALEGGKRVENDLDSVDTKGKKVGSSFGTTLANGAKAAGKAIGGMALAAGAAIGELAFDSLDASAELEATQAKFQTVFGDYQGQMLGAIDEFQRLTPASQAAAQSMTSGIQDLLVPMGFARDEATGLTADTLHLVGALTNFNSATHTAEDVTGAFQSALTGEYDSLKALGIQVSATTVKEKALEMGLADANGEVSKAAEAQALLQLATEQSGDALAAYNEASLDTKTKTELMKASFEDMQAQIGEKLLPVQQKFVDLILTNMPAIQETITRVFDAVIPIFDTFAQTVLPAIMDLLPIFADLFANVVAPAIDALLPLFTQLIEELLPPLIEFFSEIMEQILPPLVSILGSLFDALGPVLDIILDIVGDTVLPLLNTLFDALTPLLEAVFGALGPLLEALQPVFDLLADLAETILPALKPLIDLVTEAFKLLAPALDALKIPLALISDALGLIVSTIKWIIDNIGYILGMNEYQDFGFDFNNTATMAAINGYASGGYVNSTGLYKVGEQGPEVVQLQAGSYVYDAEETVAMGQQGGGNTYIFNNNNDPSPYTLMRQAERNSAIAWALGG